MKKLLLLYQLRDISKVCGDLIYVRERSKRLDVLLRSVSNAPYVAGIGQEGIFDKAFSKRKNKAGV